MTSKTFTVPIFEPNLDLLRQAFGSSIQGCQAELIKVALGWSRVYRVSLCRKGHSRRETVIVKTIDPNGPPTPLEAERELHFYQTIHPTLCIPKPQVYFLTTDEATGFHVIVMENLASTHRIPSHPHRWTRAELKSVLRAYAYLHTGTTEAFDYAWLAPRHESLLYFEEISEQVAALQRAGIWQELPGLPDLIAFARQSCQRYAGAKLSLLHGDTTPANAALPEGLDSQPATLIDWQDVGTGLAEFDLAYLDLQPFESARLISRRELLDLYWRFRAEIDPGIPSPGQHRLRQLHADAVTALWLTSTASRVALRPYPEGTYPHMHWASQFGIVYDRLKALVHEINEVSF
ncbi:MAG TPA: aminoglycoside phosphotransferase family protein [Anaerolineales bacterium]|nr:aminoglycoside phosphotransferase family protein [Anaerolineales bacterium]